MVIEDPARLPSRERSEWAAEQVEEVEHVIASWHDTYVEARREKGELIPFTWRELQQ